MPTAAYGCVPFRQTETIDWPSALLVNCWQASLSVAFGQRAPNRAAAREEGRGLGAGTKGAAYDRPTAIAQSTTSPRLVWSDHVCCARWQSMSAWCQSRRQCGRQSLWRGLSTLQIHLCGQCNATSRLGLLNKIDFVVYTGRST